MMIESESGPGRDTYNIIETVPATHVFTGGLLCNLASPDSPLSPDYLCGELTWNGSVHTLNWYHRDGEDWIRTVVSEESGIAVGMDVADITGNGRADIVTAEWPVGPGTENSGGHVFWFEQPAKRFHEPWTRHVLTEGFGKAHDLHIGDIGNKHKSDVLVRLKDGRISWFSSGSDQRKRWTETLVSEAHPGDGTALFDVTGTGGLDVVTGSGFFENIDGNGQSWKFHQFPAADELAIDVETRVVVGDFCRDGSVTVVIAESEVLENARLILLHSVDRGDTWITNILVDAERNLGALHTLQIVDVGNNGTPDIFTAEMELYVSNTEIIRRPRWMVFLNNGDLSFEERTILDVNLGAHMGGAGRISTNGRTEYVAKNWQANSDNGCGGLNHIVHVT
jgi:hypothetical protein